jgi:hypothetical protein
MRGFAQVTLQSEGGTSKSALEHAKEVASGFRHLCEHQFRIGPHAPLQGGELGTHARPNSASADGRRPPRGFGVVRSASSALGEEGGEEKAKSPNWICAVRMGATAVSTSQPSPFSLCPLRSRGRSSRDSGAHDNVDVIIHMGPSYQIHPKLYPPLLSRPVDDPQPQVYADHNN